MPLSLNNRFIHEFKTFVLISQVISSGFFENRSDSAYHGLSAERDGSFFGDVLTKLGKFSG
jgi:hypothetical protein